MGGPAGRSASCREAAASTMTSCAFSGRRLATCTNTAVESSMPRAARVWARGAAAARTCSPSTPWCSASTRSRRRGCTELRASADTDRTWSSSGNVIAFAHRVGTRYASHRLCSVYTRRGRLPPGKARRAIRAAEAMAGEWEWTTSISRSATSRRSSSGQVGPLPSRWTMTPAASSSGTSWSFAATWYAVSYSNPGPAASAWETKSRSAPPGPRPRMSQRTLTARRG